MRTLFFLIFAAFLPASAVARDVPPPDPNHEWWYDPRSKGAYYGETGSDNLSLFIECIKGEIRLGFFVAGSNYTLKRLQASGYWWDRWGTILVTFVRSDGKTYETGVAPKLIRGPHGGWFGYYTGSREDDLWSFLKGSGVVTVDTLTPFKIDLTGARSAIEQLQSSCSVRRA